MKSINRKIYMTDELSKDLKNRLAHMEEGIASDPLILSGMSFNSNFNRTLVKRILRFIDFVKKSEASEITRYFKESNDIKDLSKEYSGLYAYSPSDASYALYFFWAKNLIREDEYKLLYLVPHKSGEDFSISSFDIKKDLSLVKEWKREYTPTEMQKRIADTMETNIVLGAAGCGKTDVAVHNYINASPVDNIKAFSIRDNVFLTYSKRLSDYVSNSIDGFWNDYKNPIKKNVYTTKDFLLEVLASSNAKIEGYELINGIYYKTGVKKPTIEDTLGNQITDFNTFLSWMKSGYSGLNRAIVPTLEAILLKYGEDYPYLFYRGIFKGKIINKVSDSEITEFFLSKLHILEKEFSYLKKLFDNYADQLEEAPDFDSFSSWYQTASKRYPSDFKMLPSGISTKDQMYPVLLEYFDFANPIRDSKRYMEYYPLFKREALLTEGYRGTTRKDFDSEIEVLYQMSMAYYQYHIENNLYDDNDLCYIVSQNMNEILDKGYFKNIIIDEFQDMTERQVHTIVGLSDTEDGAIHIFGDFEQTINPTFLQLESVETIYMVNGIEDYKKQILSSTYRYSAAICRELEELREMGKKLFGTEGESSYLPLVSNKESSFEAGGNLVLDKNLGDEMLKKITSAKDVDHIMYITADSKSKEEFIKRYKCNPEKVFTVSESKGREDEFVVVYKIVSDKAKEYENIFAGDNTYSRAGRIFYNQLYVGITRCRSNFLEIEDEEALGPKTKEVLSNLITPLLKENVSLFLEEILSDKTNYYFLALDSYKNLDFKAARENLAFYSGEDFDNLLDTLNRIDAYLSDTNQKNDLYIVANRFKSHHRFDLARVLYTVLEKQDMLTLLDIDEKITKEFDDSQISQILKDNKNYISDEDLESLKNHGYFERRKKALEERISSIRSKGVR